MRDTQESGKILETRPKAGAKPATLGEISHKIIFPVSVVIFIVCAMSTGRAAENSKGVTAASAAFTKLYDFCSQANCSDGSTPYGSPPIQGLDDDLYGVTSLGGIVDSTVCNSGCGTIYKINRAGVLTTFYSFCSLTNCADGGTPAWLTLGNDGNFYGVTQSGGATSKSSCPTGCGTVFKITPQGTLTTLFNFNQDNGFAPVQLLRGANGKLYGATWGGVFQQVEGQVFVLNFQDTATFYFGSNILPQVWFQGSDYGVYGTSIPTCDQYCTVQGGWVYKLHVDGTVDNLYDFCPSESNCTYFNPDSLIEAVDGNIYGTVSGGTFNSSCPYYGCGAVYQLTPEGAFTPIYSFCSLADCADGIGPFGLIQGSDSNFYGEAGPNSGSIFKLTPGGVLTTLHAFSASQGSLPSGAVQATDGRFYGTTQMGGTHRAGTFYRLGTGLSPFVRPLVTFGTVGTKVRILGNNLIGATAVSFNGTPAVFKVGSNGNLTATVPAGATTGAISVKTSSGTLTSNVDFVVE